MLPVVARVFAVTVRSARWPHAHICRSLAGNSYKYEPQNYFLLASFEEQKIEKLHEYIHRSVRWSMKKIIQAEKHTTMRCFRT